MVVYLITNTVNGKQYVGQTIQPLKDRWRFHLSEASRCLALKAALQKYGKDSFTIQEIHKSENLEDLSKKEQEFISKFNTLAPNGYNLTTGGERPKYSEESRKKMSESGKKRAPSSAETRKKHSERMMGSKNWNFGKTFSLEHRKKLSESHIGKISRKPTPVICNETGEKYNSISHAARELNINVGHLHQVLTGKRKSAKGFTFTKVEE